MISQKHFHQVILSDSLDAFDKFFQALCEVPMVTERNIFNKIREKFREICKRSGDSLLQSENSQGIIFSKVIKRIGEYILFWKHLVSCKAIDFDTLFLFVVSIFIIPLM